VISGDRANAAQSRQAGATPWAAVGGLLAQALLGADAGLAPEPVEQFSRSGSSVLTPSTVMSRCTG
jgi:hypothetical protein